MLVHLQDNKVDMNMQNVLAGSNAHFQAYSKSLAVTGSPFDHVESRRVNVYVF